MYIIIALFCMPSWECITVCFSTYLSHSISYKLVRSIILAVCVFQILHCTKHYLNIPIANITKTVLHAQDKRLHKTLCAANSSTYNISRLREQLKFPVLPNACVPNASLCSYCQIAVYLHKYTRSWHSFNQKPMCYLKFRGSQLGTRAHRST